MDWLHGREATDLVAELREHARAVADAELGGALRKLDGLDKNAEEVISRMANRIVSKLLHQPTKQLKSRASSEDFEVYCDAVVDLFGLEHNGAYLSLTDGRRKAGAVEPTGPYRDAGLAPCSLAEPNTCGSCWRGNVPDLECEIVVITTTGDRILDTPLPVIGGKGVFTAELEQALRERSIDLAVHSLKDLPTAASPGLAVGAVIERADSADALVSRSGHSVRSLPNGASVGTSSSRRAAQLLSARPDLQIIDLRGNAGTRLRKALDPSGPYDAVVVALAALERLGRMEVVSEVLSEDMMLPAPGQGAIAVQCRDEAEGFELVRDIGHEPTELETTAERAFLEGLGGGCAVPVAARARLGEDGWLHIKGRVVALDGSTRVDVEADEQVSLGDRRPAGGLRRRLQARGRGALPRRGGAS